MTGGPLVYIALALGCGALIAVQAATNVSLIKSVGSVPYAAEIRLPSMKNLIGIGFIILGVALARGG